MKWKKVLSLCLAAVTVVSAALLTGCGGGGASSDTSFTMWIYQGENAQYYTDYADNPVLQWMTAQKSSSGFRRRARRSTAIRR